MGDKIVIIGNAGGGKSVLSAKLSKTFDIPVFKLDTLQWNPGWVPTPVEQFKWIIDGFATMESVEKRCKAATTIIFIDHPVLIHLWWALKRQFLCLFRPRPDFVDGCPMIPMTGKLLKMILDIDKFLKPKIKDILKQYENSKEMYHIKSPIELNRFTNRYCS